MDKVLVEIYVPAANKSYDVFLPLFSKMSEIFVLVSRTLEELSEGNYKADEQSILCDAETGAIYNINLSVQELKIKNGSKLMLI